MAFIVGRMEFRASWILIILMFLILVVFFFARNWDEEQKINSIKYTGLSYLTKSELTDALENGIIGSVKSTIDPDSLRKRLSSIKFIEDFTINYPSGGVLEIAVTEREIVAIALTPKGEPGLIDKNGILLPFRNDCGLEGLPIVRCEGKCKHYAEKMSNTVEILGMVTEKCNDKFRATISEIIYNGNSESYELIVNGNYNRILLGSVKSLETSFEKLMTFIENKRINFNNVDYDYIDLRWTGQIIVHEAS